MARLNPPVLINSAWSGTGSAPTAAECGPSTTEVNGLIVLRARRCCARAFLLVERRATRDFPDVAALALKLGDHAALKAVGYLNAVYRPPPRKPW
jgi:hypothetical protein